ncbi:MAG: hypothetical protein Nk1A_7130 [Endomicrobiia bacterium]|nr:MAG: hypothetical protein Nk1A_7130 [Endomicrobiia bacterium]
MARFLQKNPLYCSISIAMEILVPLLKSEGSLERELGKDMANALFDDAIPSPNTVS